jgi:Protein of unknown function (DUF2845)
MRAIRRIASAAIVASLLATSPAGAHALRCGTRIISRGDIEAKLLKFCGEPDARQRRLERRTEFLDAGVLLPGFVNEVWVEEWTYNLGPYKLIRVVRLENGVVADIRQLGYGY